MATSSSIASPLRRCRMCVESSAIDPTSARTARRTTDVSSHGRMRGGRGNGRVRERTGMSLVVDVGGRPADGLDLLEDPEGLGIRRLSPTTRGELLVVHESRDALALHRVDPLPRDAPHARSVVRLTMVSLRSRYGPDGSIVSIGGPSRPSMMRHASRCAGATAALGRSPRQPLRQSDALAAGLSASRARTRRTRRRHSGGHAT